MANYQISQRLLAVPRSIALVFAAGAGLMPGATAQTTHVVGTGGTYSTIAAAIAATSPGDTVLVNGGTWYETLVIDRGIHFVGRGASLRDAAFNFPVRIQNVPRGQTVVMTGFQADSSPGAIDTRIEVTDCDGLVTVQNLRQGGFQQWHLVATNCAQLHVSRTVLAGARLDSCTAVVQNCVFDPDLLDGLSVTGGRTALVQCTIRGGLGIFPGVGISASNAELAITGSTVRATGPSNPAIRTTAGGAVLLTPSTTLTATGSQPAVSGNATVAPYHFASVTASTNGQLLSFATDGPAGEPFLTLLSLPQPVTSSPYGFAWIDPVAWGVLQSGTFPASGPVAGALPHPALPPGLAVTIQAVHLTPIGVALSTPTVVAVP